MTKELLNFFADPKVSTIIIMGLFAYGLNSILTLFCSYQLYML